MTCVKPSKKEKVLLSQCIKADCLERQVETEIMDSVMGPAVYDSRIRPSGINGTGRTTAFSFYPQQSPVERKYSVALLPSESLLNQGIFQMELHLFTSMFLWGVFQPLTTLKWWVPDCSFLSLASLIIHQDVEFYFVTKIQMYRFFHFHAVLSTVFNPYSKSSQTCWKLDRKFHF